MSSIFGARTVEEPAFTVIKKTDVYEVREYGPQIRAVVTVDGDVDSATGPAFRALAGFIFGKNESRQKIAMTAPVGMTTSSSEAGQAQKIAMTAPVGMTHSEAGGKKSLTMTFTMPSKFKSIDELPVPQDSRVKLVEAPAHKVAVISFSWGLTEARMHKKEAELRAAAARDGLKLSDKPEDVVLNGYNPPWTLPWWKHNEVCIPVLD